MKLYELSETVCFCNPLLVKRCSFDSVHVMRLCQRLKRCTTSRFCFILPNNLKRCSSTGRTWRLLLCCEWVKIRLDWLNRFQMFSLRLYKDVFGKHLCSCPAEMLLPGEEKAKAQQNICFLLSWHLDIFSIPISTLIWYPKSKPLRTLALKTLHVK